MMNCACAGSEFAIVLLALHVVGQMVCTCMRYKIMTLVLYPPLRGATALNTDVRGMGGGGGCR